MDKKIVSIEEQYNQQNKIYFQISHEMKENVLRVQRGHYPTYVMVWWEVSHQGMTHFHFCKKGVTGVQVFQEDVPQIVKHLNMTLFSGQEWVL